MKITSITTSIKRKFHNARGKKVWQFTLFVFISFIFWLAITLNEEFRFDIKCPIKINNIPDGTTLISLPPSAIKVNVKSKGLHFLKYKLKDAPILEIDYKKYHQINRIALGTNELQEISQQVFGINSNATTFSPDSIIIFYTTTPGKNIKLVTNIDTNTENNYIISGIIESDIDSVTLYAINDIPSNIISLETELIKCKGITQNTTIKAKVKTPNGMRAIPDSVNVAIQVESLISKRRMAQIEILNTPENRRLITFPSQIEINYLVPKSLFNNEDNIIKVVVDYKDIYINNSKLPIKFIDIPSNYKSVTSKIDSVEYIIEQ